MNDNNIPIDELIDIDLHGYFEGENDPECTEEVFDLHGRLTIKSQALI